MKQNAIRKARKWAPARRKEKEKERARDEAHRAMMSRWREGKRDRGRFIAMKVRALGYADYAAYTKGRWWRHLRELYHSAYGPLRCVGCLSYTDIQLHHLRYDRLGHESLKDLVPLCSDCHRKVHEVHDRARIPLGDVRTALGVAFGLTPTDVSSRLRRYDSLPS